MAYTESSRIELDPEEWEIALAFAYEWNSLNLIEKRCFLVQNNQILLRITPMSPAGKLFLQFNLAVVPAKTVRLLFTPLADRIARTFLALQSRKIVPQSSPQEMLNYLVQGCPFPSLFRTSRLDARIFQNAEWLQSLVELGPDGWIAYWRAQKLFSSSNEKALLEKLHVLALEHSGHPQPIRFEDMPGDVHSRILLAQCAVNCGFWIPQWSSEGFLFHWVLPLRPKQDPDAPLHFNQKLEGGFLLEDMRAILSLLGRKRLRYSESERRLYKKHYDEIAKELHPLPPWLGQYTRIVADSGLRAEYALQVLERLPLVESDYSADGESHSILQVVRPAISFLHGEQAACAKILYQLVPPAKGKPYQTDFPLPFPQLSGVHLSSEGERQIVMEISSRLAGLEVGAIVPLRELKAKWVPYPNILFTIAAKHGQSTYQQLGTADWEQDMDHVLLHQLLWHSSCSVLDLHHDSQNQQLGISLTPLGKALLQRQSPLPFPQSGPAVSVIVKPDYEIVFLQASSRAEAELAVFCRRIHTGHVGALFRITRDALFQAMEHGKTSEGFLDALRSCCASIPQNVLTEIQSWQESTRVATTRHIQILQFASEEDARHAVSLHPKGLAHLGGHNAEVRFGASLRDIRKQLAKSLILVR